MSNKKDLFPKFETELEGKTSEEIIKLLFDYFDNTELEKLLKHIQTENGSIMESDDSEDQSNNEFNNLPNDY